MIAFSACKTAFKPAAYSAILCPISTAILGKILPSPAVIWSAYPGPPGSGAAVICPVVTGTTTTSGKFLYFK